MISTTTVARLYVTTYNLYNRGLQFSNSETSFWFDPSSYSLTEIEFALTQAELKQGIYNGEDIELMFTDYENIPETLYSESLSYVDYEKIVEYCGLDEDELVGYRYLAEDLGYDHDEAVRRASEVILFEGDSESYAMQLVEDCYSLPEIAERYFDYKSFAYDLTIGGDIYELERDRLVTNCNEF